MTLPSALVLIGIAMILILFTVGILSKLGLVLLVIGVIYLLYALFVLPYGRRRE